MHESPVRRAAPQHPEVAANDSNGPEADTVDLGGLRPFAAVTIKVCNADKV
jgi:hypothetical protein